MRPIRPRECCHRNRKDCSAKRDLKAASTRFVLRDHRMDSNSISRSVSQLPERLAITVEFGSEIQFDFKEMVATEHFWCQEFSLYLIDLVAAAAAVPG